MEIFLSNDDLWTEADGTMVSGNGFLDGQFLSEKDLADEISALDTRDGLKRFLSRTNGFFSLIHHQGDRVHVAVDHVRSWPVFYAATDDVYISDSAEWVHEAGAHRGYDPVSATEYLYTCFVSGRQTLSRDVKQVQAGELVTLSEDTGESGSIRDRYFEYYPNECSETITEDELDKAFSGAFERLIDYADGRTILVGLSGGYDSRLIALMLYRLGYDNTVTYTTGAASADSEEMSRAKSVANDLGFEHIMVTSDRSDYRHIENSDQMKILEDIGYLSEYPHINKLILKRNLEKAGVTPEDVVHVLGHNLLHAGSFLPGWVRDQDTLSRAELTDFLWDLHYEHWETPDDRDWQNLFEGQMLKRVPRDLYRTGMVEPKTDAVGGFEYWYWQERLPKFIIARREYEYLGFDVWYPMLDRELFSVFETSNHRQRIGRRILKQYVRRLDERIRNTESDLNPDNDDTQRSVTDLAWQQTIRVVHALPDPAMEFIQRAYNQYRSRSAYQRDARHNIVSEEEFNSISFPNVDRGTLFRTLLLFYLYRNGFFELPTDNEFERALDH